MSHMIRNNMIAWRGERPWHGLGVDVSQILQTMPADTQGKAMLQAAGMDWSVQRRMLAMRGADGEGLLTQPLSGFRAIVREDTNEVFQVATDRYHPLQNAQIVDFFREYCAAGHAELETVGALQGGRKVWALAKLNGQTTDTLAGNDKLTGYLLLATSHDGSLRTLGKATQVRVVCWNTLSAAISEKGDHEFRAKHTQKWTPALASEARRRMGMAVEAIQKTNQLARTLSQVTIDGQSRLEYVWRLTQGESLLDQVVNDAQAMGSLDAILHEHELCQQSLAPSEDKLSRAGKAVLEAIVNSPGSDLPSAKNTLWGAVNGATWYADHEYGRNQDNRMAASWFGPGETLKNKAVQVAVDMAGIR